MLKRTTVVAAAAAFIFAAAATPADAGRKGRNVAIGVIAAIGAAAAFSAAAHAARRNRHRDRYRYYDGASERDNAIAACLHKAHRRTIREGGDGIDFLRVSRAKRKRTGYIIGAHVVSYGPWGDHERYAKCRIHHDRVVKCRWE